MACGKVFYAEAILDPFSIDYLLKVLLSRDAQSQRNADSVDGVLPAGGRDAEGVVRQASREWENGE